MESSDTSLADALPPPWWLKILPPVRNLWMNPVFQRRYVLNRVPRTMSTTRAFWTGAMLIGIVDLICLFTSFSDHEIWIVYTQLVLLILGAIAGYAAIRMVLNLLTVTQVEFRGELKGNLLLPVFITLLSDREIYFAECFASMLRGLGAIEEISAFFLGALTWFAIPLFFLSPVLFELTVDSIFQTLVIILVAVLTSIAILFPLFLFIGFTGGLYAVLLPTTRARIATLVHVVVLLSVNSLVSIFVLISLFELDLRHYHRLFDVYKYLATYPASIFFQVILLILAIIETAWIGLIFFSRARRAGV